MKCREYNSYSVLCLQCDIQEKIPCCKTFEFDMPMKYVNVERTDHMAVSWNECPICGKSIGYHPKDEDFRCPKCTQRILWK